MKNWVLYYSPHCPDCPPVLRDLVADDADVEYVDITGTMLSLKRFLSLRDHCDAFAAKKETGQVGIPALVKNDGEAVYFTWEEMEAAHPPKRKEKQK